MEIYYAKFIDSTKIDTEIPSANVIDGVMVVGRPTEEQLRKLGYYPVHDPGKPPEKDGYVLSTRYSIVHSWSGGGEYDSNDSNDSDDSNDSNDIVDSSYIEVAYSYEKEGGTQGRKFPSAIDYDKERKFPSDIDEQPGVERIFPSVID